MNKEKKEAKKRKADARNRLYRGWATDTQSATAADTISTDDLQQRTPAKCRSSVYKGAGAFY